MKVYIVLIAKLSGYSELLERNLRIGSRYGMLTATIGTGILEKFHLDVTYSIDLEDDDLPHIITSFRTLSKQHKSLYCV
jgi:hypothetical protein